MAHLPAGTVVTQPPCDPRSLETPSDPVREPALASTASHQAVPLPHCQRILRQSVIVVRNSAHALPSAARTVRLFGAAARASRTTATAPASERSVVAFAIISLPANRVSTTTQKCVATTTTTEVGGTEAAHAASIDMQLLGCPFLCEEGSCSCLQRS